MHKLQPPAPLTLDQALSSDPRLEALVKGDVSLCQRLLKGSRATEAIGGVPPIGWAVESGSLPLVSWLLKQPGTDIDQRDSKGRTPLHRLLRSSNPGLSEGARALMLRGLIRRGADPTRPDEAGNSALHVAERYFPEYTDELYKAQFVEPSVPLWAPLASMPKARPWKGKSRSFKLTARDLAGWGAAAGLACITVALLVNPPDLKPRDDAFKARQNQAWKTHLNSAEQAFNKAEYQTAASCARAALDCDRGAESEKGRVYALGLQSYLKRVQSIKAETSKEIAEIHLALNGANIMLQEYYKRGPRDASRDQEMKGHAQQLSTLGQAEVARMAQQVRGYLTGGNVEQARLTLGSARDLMAQLQLPASPEVDQLKAEVEQAQLAKVQQAEAARSERRAKQEAEEARRREERYGRRSYDPYRSTYQTPILRTPTPSRVVSVPVDLPQQPDGAAYPQPGYRSNSYPRPYRPGTSSYSSGYRPGNSSSTAYLRARPRQGSETLDLNTGVIRNPFSSTTSKPVVRYTPPRQSTEWRTTLRPKNPYGY